MNELGEFSIPLLFKILFLFMALNIACNLLLYKISFRRIHRYLFFYWVSLVIVFFVEGVFQKNHLQVSLGYHLNIIPMTLLANLLCETFKRKISYLVIGFSVVTSVVLTFIADGLNLDFVYIAIPGSILIAVPLVMASYVVVKNWQDATLFQRLLGVIYGLMPIHCLNFAFFRMDENAQLWGWFVSWSIFQVLAVILPCFALEEIAKNENIRVSNITKNLRERIVLLEAEKKSWHLSANNSEADREENPEQTHH